ncbi:glycoside hydrolase/deacetylase, partial [Hesseltinella vesiculosa]
DIAVPKNDEWLTQVDLSLVPNLPVRPVGSGTCKAAKCDGSDNDKCFETCGNKAIPSDMYGCPRPLEWALTFDDGPSQYTGELLDYLDSLGIKATFCVMGSNVKQYPQFVKRAHESGHLIASHTYSHPHLMSLTNEQIINEIKATEEAVFDVTGFRPSYVRPPYGEADERVKALLKTMGYKILMWNVDPTDYDVYSLPFGGDMIQSAFRKAADGKDTGLNALNDPGYISLQHDLYKESVQQVPEVVKYLTSKGYRFVTVAECTKEED